MHMRAIYQAASIRLFNASYKLKQRRLAGAVGTHQGNLFFAPDVEVEPVIDDLVAIDFSHTFQVHDAIPGALGLREVKVHRLFLLGDDDAIFHNALELAHAILRLLGLRSLVAKLLDEGLQVRNLFVLSFLHGDELLTALDALTLIIGIVAGVELQLAVCYLHNVVNHAVHEGAVMRYDEHSAIIAAQEVLQPAHRLQVQVIGRLVEQEDIRLR